MSNGDRQHEQDSSRGRDRRRQVAQDIAEEVRVASGLVLIVALWQLVSPWWHGYSFSSIATWSDLITAALLALIALAGFFNWFGLGTSQWTGWIMMLVGLWLFLSPMLLPFDSPLSRATDIIVGMGVIALGVLSAMTARGMVSTS